MTGIIILAAGSSGRLGTPKQNLIYRGQTLLQRTIATALATACKPVLVVLGANAAAIKPSIENLTVTVIENADWSEGMASSIRAGILAMQKIEPAVKAVILLLCDQPFIETHILNLLILSKSRSGISACSYDDTIGPPALFDVVYFDELLSLKGQEGAKKLLMKYQDDVTVIPFPQGSIDIDTLADYEKLQV